MAGEQASKCEHMVYEGTAQWHGLPLEFYTCNLRKALLYRKATSGTQIGGGLCWQGCGAVQKIAEGRDPMEDPFFAQMVRTARSRIVVVYHKSDPKRYTRDDFYDAVFADHIADVGKTQAKKDLLEAVEDEGLDPQKADELSQTHQLPVIGEIST